MNKNRLWFAAGFIAIAICGISFYGGMKYASTARVSTRSTGQFNQGQFTAGVGRGNFGGGGVANGQILSKDASSITISLRGGGSKIILLSGSTAILKSTAGSIEDLTVGKDVTVAGSANSDGSITAQTISERPAMMATSTGAR